MLEKTVRVISHLKVKKLPAEQRKRRDALLAGIGPWLLQM